MYMCALHVGHVHVDRVHAHVQVGILLMWHSLAASVGALIGGSVFDAHGRYVRFRLSIP